MGVDPFAASFVVVDEHGVLLGGVETVGFDQDAAEGSALVIDPLVAFGRAPGEVCLLGVGAGDGGARFAEVGGVAEVREFAEVPLGVEVAVCQSGLGEAAVAFGAGLQGGDCSVAEIEPAEAPMVGILVKDAHELALRGVHVVVFGVQVLQAKLLLGLPPLGSSCQMS